ncbi:MAG: FHA domain-containing protein [Clostridia bacterium]|nr:FHA domain-containing protein [Clostridia bacterium]
MNQIKLDKRTVAGILLVIAILTMFFDCVSFSGGSDFSRMLGLSSSVTSSLYGNSSEGKAVTAISRMFESGGLTVFEMRGLFVNMRKLDRDETYSAFSIVFAVLILTTLFAAGYALYGVYLRKKARGFWFASMMLVLIMAEGIIAAAYGSGYYTSTSMTLWPFIGLGCAIASIVLCFKAARPSLAPTSGAPAAPSAGLGGQSLANEFAKVLDIGKALGKQVGQKVGKAAASAANAAANAAASAAAANSWTCPQCGRPVDGSARFCSACGAPRPEKRFCPKCGSECKDGAAFCSKCGFRLTDIGGQSGQQPAFRAPAQGAPVMQQTMPYAQQAMPNMQQSVYPAADVSAQSTSTTMRVPVNNALPPLCLCFELKQDHTGFFQECRLNILTSLTVGRNPGNDLRVDDNVVSGSHLRIDRNGDSLLVTDLNSSNGTVLNGVPLNGTAPLNNGDELQIGFTRLKVRW